MTEDEKSNEPSAISIEWPRAELDVVRAAAALTRASLSSFVRQAAGAEAERVLKEREGLMDLTAAAELLGITRGEVVRLISAGALRARKVDDEWLVDQESARAAMGTAAKDDRDQIELDLRDLVSKAGLADLATSGEAPGSLTATWCYVSQEGILVCPSAAWSRLGRDGVLSEARDAVKRHLRRKDRESGKL